MKEIPLLNHSQSFIISHHQSVLLKGRSFIANAGSKIAVLSKGRSYTASSGTKVVVLLGINRCGSFSFLSVPHSLFTIWTDLKRSEKIPGVPTWKWGEWICAKLGPPYFTEIHHRIKYQIRDPEIPITLRSQAS